MNLFNSLFKLSFPIFKKKFQDDSQDCTLDDDTGLCCMIKDMEYETIQKVRHN